MVGMCRSAQLFVQLILLLQGWTPLLAVVIRTCVYEDILNVHKFHELSARLGVAPVAQELSKASSAEKNKISQS